MITLVADEKDYQQLAVIRSVVQDPGIDIRIVGAPPEANQSGGERDAATMLQMARQQFTATSSGTLEYPEVCDPDTLRSVSTYRPERVLIAMVFKTGPRADGTVPLIDNRVLDYWNRPTGWLIQSLRRLLLATIEAEALHAKRELQPERLGYPAADICRGLQVNQPA